MQPLLKCSLILLSLTLLTFLKILEEYLHHSVLSYTMVPSPYRVAVRYHQSTAFHCSAALVRELRVHMVLEGCPIRRIRVYQMSLSNEVRLDYDTHDPLRSLFSASTTLSPMDSRNITRLCQDSLIQPDGRSYVPALLFPSYPCESTEHITPPNSISSASSNDRQDEQLV